MPTGAALGSISNAPVMKMPSKDDLKELKAHHEAIITARRSVLRWELSYVAEIMAVEDPDLEKMVPRAQRETYKKVKRELESNETSLSKVDELLAAMDTPRCSLGPLRSFSGY